MKDRERPRIVAVVGPTATGKTRIAMELAEAFSGEVISADSMQVYRGMDIGTAKPSARERERVPHHLVDVVDPDTEYTAARFRDEAAEKIIEITARGNLPIVAGGTGLYIRALTRGLFEGPEADEDLRDELMNEALVHGKEHLFRRLKEVDPEAAAATHPNNLRRVVRALEVYELSKRPITEFQREHAFSEAPYDDLKVGLMKDRRELYRGINARVDRMISRGLVEETERLLAEGYTPDLKPMNGLGYKEVIGYIQGNYTLERAVELIKRNTRRYAKRQMTWFRKEPGVEWFPPEDSPAIEKRVREHLS